LERQVSRLQAALRQSSERRSTTYRREGTWAIAAFILAFGFTLGVYREPIQEVVVGLAQTLGLARGNSDVAYDAYDEGRYGTALRLARPLASEGDARAQSLLGLLYYRGLGGVPQDDAEAMKWFRSAADRGDARAQYHLGLFYAHGMSGETDNVSAHMWFNLASARFPASDISFRNASRVNRDLVAQKMTPYELAEAQKLAREWKPKSN
jgi:TPR repeat protein